MSVHEIITDRVVARIEEAIKTGERFRWCKPFTGGVTITKPLNEITFLDVYKAVECAPDEELFHFHENPNQECPVGRNIHHVLDDKKWLVDSWIKFF